MPLLGIIANFLIRIFTRFKGVTILLGSLISKVKGFIQWAALGTWILSFGFEIFRKILGIIGLGGAVTTGAFSFVQVKKLLEGIGDPQGYLLDYIHTALSKLPYSMQTILSSVDSTLANLTGDYFNPDITLTYLLQVTAVGECFNQLLMSAIQNTIFVFSIYLIRWAFTNNVTYTQTPPQPRV